MQNSSAPSPAEALAEDLEDLVIQPPTEDPQVVSAVGALQDGVAAMGLRRTPGQIEEPQRAQAGTGTEGEAAVGGASGAGEGDGEGNGEGERRGEGSARGKRKGSRGQRGGPSVHKDKSGGAGREKGVGNKEIGTAAYHANRKRKAKKVKKEK